MKKIEDIDANFAVQNAAGSDFLYRRVASDIPVEGLPFASSGSSFAFRRFPETPPSGINNWALYLGNCTTGAAVRFKTSAKVVMLQAQLSESMDLNHMPRAASSGFDSYIHHDSGYVYHKTLQPTREQVDGKEVLLGEIGSNPDGEMLEYLINFPLYGGVKEVFIGIPEGAEILPPSPHEVKLPIVFYGSSITQGGCASRPGNAYTSMLCRAVDAEQINFGFSGAAKGEKAVAELISKIPMSVFVLDYDHNAPDEKSLAETHGEFFRIIRQAQPEVPIIMISRCDVFAPIHPKHGNLSNRREIIRKTYLDAVSRGDRNVYFIDGATLFDIVDRDACTVDGTHPNDLGFYRMYETILPVLRRALCK